MIESIKNQKYPSKLLDVYVVADNCTDETARVAREAGATVFERFNNRQVGKGYALEFLFQKLQEQFCLSKYDGYFIFDADNLLDENYVAEMNKTFSAGYRIITSYRNSKNYGSNWISAGYSLWFLREARYLNNPRMIIGSSCAVSGTGFLIHHDVVEKNGGWKHFLLTEDIEFTVDSILHGEKIGYCGTAVLYDEQPVTFAQSWRQRLRWAKGYLQVFRHYGLDLIKGSIFKLNFSCYDMAMSIMPAIVLTMFSFLVNVSMSVFSILTMNGEVMTILRSLLESLVNAYGLLFLFGGVTLITEWKQIHCSVGKRSSIPSPSPCLCSPISPFPWWPSLRKWSGNLFTMALAKNWRISGRNFFKSTSLYNIQKTSGPLSYGVVRMSFLPPLKYQHISLQGKSKITHSIVVTNILYHLSQETPYHRGYSPFSTHSPIRLHKIRRKYS